MEIVAIKDMSNGNETVGEMWKETKIFGETEPLKAVMDWVGSRKKNVVLTIAHNEETKVEEHSSDLPF